MVKRTLQVQPAKARMTLYLTMEEAIHQDQLSLALT
jgi:hypothetical protein